MKSIRSHLWPIVILVIIGLIGTKALLHSGWYTSHDGEHQLVRQYFFDRALKAGHIPPRVDRQLLNGLGYPLFTFTYQLPFILGEPLRLVGISTQDVVKVVFVLAYIASGLTMYLFVQGLWGKPAGLLSGFLYLWAPYRFSLLFVRASLGEHIAMIFPPLILWAINRKFLHPGRLIVGSLSVAGLILSHMMITQIFLVPLGLIWLAQIFFTPAKLKFILHTILIGFGTLGLTAYYLLPAYYLRSINAIPGLNRHFYADHFVTLKQLLYSPWGYGFSVLGPNDGLSLQIGFAQWLVISLVLIIIFIHLWKRKSSSHLAIALLTGFALSVFMMLRISDQVWNNLVKQWYIVDLPWRWLAVSVFTSAVLAAFIYSELRSHLAKIVFLVIVISIALVNSRHYLRVNKYIDSPDSDLSQYRGTSTSYDEYQPARTNKAMFKNRVPQEVEVVSGNIDFNITHSVPHQLVLTANVKSPGMIQLNTTYFPGWTLLVDNQVQPILDYTTHGIVQLPLNSGTHTVNLDYRPIQVMQIGTAISVFTLGLLGVLWLK